MPQASDALATLEAPTPDVVTTGSELARDSREFLDAFMPPDDTVRVSGPAELRLWDQLLVAELPDVDPLREIDPSTMPWAQVQGALVPLRDSASLQATAVFPEVAERTLYAFVVRVRNAAGERRLTVVVQVNPR